MKRVFVPIAMSFALIQPAISETAWGKLEKGVDVIRECAGDIRTFCKGVKPGKGRIKTCMAGHLADLSDACMKALAEPKPQVLSDGANPKPMRVENSHLMRFIEMYLAGIDPNTGNIVGECYGTYANPMPANKDTSPQALVAALDMKKIKEKYGVLAASLNGPKLYIQDWFEFEAGAVREFGGLKAPWTAELNLGKEVSIAGLKPYKPMTIARKSAVGWNKGTKVMVLDDDAGNTWIMKGFELGLKPKYTYDQFMSAGAANFKQLPPGWKVRVVTLAQDNVERPEGGVAIIMMDEFQNVYDKTGPGMSNSKP